MNKFLKAVPAALLAACACASGASAQEATQAPRAVEPAVRERRVESAESRDAKDAPKEAASGPAASDAETEALRSKAESAENPAERGRLRLALAERLAEGGRRAEALELLRAVLGEERFDPQLFYNAGNVLARLGESEPAAGAYRKAIEQRRGGYSRAQHNLGVVLTRLGRWEEAEEALRSALRLESDTYAEASYSLGRLHALRGDPALAEAEWARTLRLRPDHGAAAAALARSLADGGEAERALAVLDAFGARMKTRGADVPREVTVARGEIVAAANVVASRRAAGLGPSEPETSAAAPRAESRPASAAAPPDSTELLRAARGRKGAGAPPVVDRHTYTLLHGARAARAGEREEEAVALYRRAIAAVGGYLAPANMELGFTLSAMRRHGEAAAALLPVVRKEGGRYPLVFYHLGRIYEHLGRLGEAGEAFARASELAGEESPQFYIDLSRVREREGRLGDALAASENYLRVTSRAAAAPEWARERVEALRRKAAEAAAAPAAKQ